MSVSGNTGGGYAAFNNVTANLLAGSNALIFITNSAASTNQWWQFHVLDVVGFNQTNHTLDVVDPDNNKYGAFGFPGTNSSPPATGFYTNSFGVAVPYNIVPYNTNEAIPVVGGWSDVGGSTNSLVQAYTIDANGNITDGIYAGTSINSIDTIGMVPEPSSLALGLMAASAMSGYWRMRRRV